MKLEERVDMVKSSLLGILTEYELATEDKELFTRLEEIRDVIVAEGSEETA